jgi:hypothetical protein
MTKPILKGLWLVGLVAVIAVLSVPAEAAEVRCNIPFRFSVNGRTLPQGDYQVSTAAGTMIVRGAGTGAVALTYAVESRELNVAQLVFHKQGDRYFLRQVWTGGGGGRELPMPREERSLAEAARQDKVGTKGEVVAIPLTGF